MKGKNLNVHGLKRKYPELGRDINKECAIYSEKFVGPKIFSENQRRIKRIPDGELIKERRKKTPES